MKEILIVDDDADLSFIISEMLESYGYKVTTTESGDEAFSLLTQRSFHLLLLDINLPDTTGLDINVSVAVKILYTLLFKIRVSRTITKTSLTK